MARTFRSSGVQRVANSVISTLIRLGIAPKGLYLLIVRGRKSDQIRSTPVTLIETADQRYLVAPYGAVPWVHNVRAADTLLLRRGSRTETMRAVELAPEASAPILKRYITDVAIVRPYFDTLPTAPAEAFITEAQHKPVFALMQSSASA